MVWGGFGLVLGCFGGGFGVVLGFFGGSQWFLPQNPSSPQAPSPFEFPFTHPRGSFWGALPGAGVTLITSRWDTVPKVRRL